MTELPKYLRVADHRTGTTRPVAINTAAPASAERYAASAYSGELDTLAGAAEGQRNATLNIAAFNLAQLVVAGHLDHDTTWNALYTTAVAIGLTPAETRGTLHSAFQAGREHPRAIPDLAEVPAVTVIHAPAAEAAEGPEEQPEPPGIRQRFPALDWADLWNQEEEEEWIVRPILPARRLVALFSAPKLGKSLLMLELAVAIARGTTVLGETPDRPRRVLYVDFENDPRGDVRSRLRDMGYGPGDLGDLVYLSYPQLTYLDTALGGLELLAICREYEVEVVVIDTISRAVKGEENDNDTWLGFYRNTGLALKAAGIATIRLDHTGKDPAKGMRGGSAKYGDVDAVWSMTGLSDTTFRLECTANRLPVHEKVLTVRRETQPLRHHVITGGAKAALEPEVEACIKDLDRLNFPVGGPRTYGREKAIPLLDANGLHYSKAVVGMAVGARKERPSLIHRPWEEDA